MKKNESKEFRARLAKERRRSKKKFRSFVNYTKKDYDTQWFHSIVCSYLDKLAKREIKKLMIFMPPQHGKSELSSRRFPAYLLGKNPTEKLILGSYNQTKASEFVTECKRIMQSPSYQYIFDSQIKGADRAEYFEVQHEGYLKGVGMDSGVTGNTADGFIIDDPFKGRNEANSQGVRDKIWRTYSDDFQTRIHNNSFLLMLFTRWHHDDIAGRILNPDSEYYDEQEAKEWTVLVFQALKEHKLPDIANVNYYDPRDIGEALWEDRHSRKRLETRKRVNPTGFTSLDQQRPTAEEGEKILKEWFQKIKRKELPFNPNLVKVDFFVDGAYTEKSKNDETGLLACHFNKATRRLYIFNCIGVRKTLTNFLKFFPTYADSNYNKNNSLVYIEPKASGKSILSMIETEEHGNFNAKEITYEHVQRGKWNRVEDCEPYLSSGRVYLVEGGWNKEFVSQCTSFPNAALDDMVDVLCYAILHYFEKSQSKNNLENVSGLL